MSISFVLAVLAIASGPQDQHITPEHEAPIVAEARAFMDDYARDLTAGDRKALAARYDRRGAWRLGGGEKVLDSFDAIKTNYATSWPQPAAFEWTNLSFEPAGPDAVVVAGQFKWTVKPGKAPMLFSYTGLLVRQDGELRIRLEDEDPAPAK